LGGPREQAGYAFTGREWDPEIGLYYYRARYYDPKVGRFVSEDPIGFAGGENHYSYVSNDPTTAIDPLGLVRFWSEEGSPVTQDDFNAVYLAVHQLRATLDPAVKDFFKTVYGDDAGLDALLSPGAGPEVELYRCDDETEGSSKNGKTRLNVASLRDPHLLGAALLHELAEALDHSTWFPGEYPNTSEALASAAEAVAVAQSKGQFFHGKNPFLAEY
jgi:RHS repeat-associated protein